MMMRDKERDEDEDDDDDREKLNKEIFHFYRKKIHTHTHTKRGKEEKKVSSKNIQMDGWGSWWTWEMVDFAVDISFIYLFFLSFF